jgi:hypothetical protein
LDVPDEHVTSIFRAEEQVKQEPSMKHAASSMDYTPLQPTRQNSSRRSTNFQGKNRTQLAGNMAQWRFLCHKTNKAVVVRSMKTMLPGDYFIIIQ